MDRSLRRELDYCINELNAIVRQLYEASDDVAESITGMNTKKYTKSIDKAADKYKKAANKLKKIR